MGNAVAEIIFTADDFGLCADVNEAIERAARDGVLSAASLMVAAPAAADAIARAKRLPELRVGLHLTLVDGRPLLPPHEIPTLVGETGAFETNLAKAGVRWFFLPAARRELRKEIRAQFEAFKATGLTLDHVNAHNHMHIHPTVFAMVLEIGAEYGMKALRLPSEPPDGLLSPFLSAMRQKLTRRGLRFNNRLVGLRCSGSVTEEVVMAGLENLGDGVTEFYFHPAMSTTAELEAQAPGYDREGELAALLSPRVRGRIATLGIKTKGFNDLDV